MSDQLHDLCTETSSQTSNVLHEISKPVTTESNSFTSNDAVAEDITSFDLNYMETPMDIGFDHDKTNGVLTSTMWPKSQSLTSLSRPGSGITESEMNLTLPAAAAVDTFLGQLAECSAWNLDSHTFDQIENHLVEPFPLSIDGSHDLSAELQADDTSFFTFPDDRILEVPSLTLLNAAVKVAQRLNLNNLIWDFTAVSPFYNPESSNSSISSPSSLETGLSISATSPASSVDLTELPPHLLPTRTQCMIPHHPIIDLLPWPSTRDKLIQVFHLPVNLRPSTAQDPMGLLRLVYDMEDGGGEGMRISGDDPFEPSVWEIGQVMFERWWWAFEISVVERCNRARGNRGERVLSLEGPKERIRKHMS